MILSRYGFGPVLLFVASRLMVTDSGTAIEGLLLEKLRQIRGTVSALKNQLLYQREINSTLRIPMTRFNSTCRDISPKLLLHQQDFIFVTPSRRATSKYYRRRHAFYKSTLFQVRRIRIAPCISLTRRAQWHEAPARSLLSWCGRRRLTPRWWC